MDGCYAYGQNPSLLRERYLEAHDLIIRAWAEKDTFAFNGRFNQQRYVNVWPRPIQRPHPPIWIPGGGSVETWRWCAEKDYVYSYLSYYGHKVGKATMDGFWNEMDRLGKDRNPYRAGFAQTVAVAESRQQAIDLYTEAAEYFFGRCLHIDQRWVAPPGYATEATQRVGMESQVLKAATYAEKFKARPTSMAELVDAGYLVIGTPDEVVEQIAGTDVEPERRPPYAAHAVRQHEQGAHQLQHPDVRRARQAEDGRGLRGVGGPLVAEADGARGAGGATRVHAAPRGRIDARQAGSKAAWMRARSTGLAISSSNPAAIAARRSVAAQ